MPIIVKKKPSRPRRTTPLTPLSPVEFWAGVFLVAFIFVALGLVAYGSVHHPGNYGCALRGHCS